MSSTTVLAPELVNLGDELMFERGESHAAFKLLRKHDPIHWNPGNEQVKGWWDITRYEDVLHVSRNHNIFSSEGGGRRLAGCAALFAVASFPFFDRSTVSSPPFAGATEAVVSGAPSRKISKIARHFVQRTFFETFPSNRASSYR